MKKKWVYIFVFAVLITGIVFVSSINLDLNHDGAINIQDLQLLASHYEGKATYNSSFDLNKDGIVNLFDTVAIARDVNVSAGICAATGGAKCYYVSTKGSDSNPGTYAKPFLTFKPAVNAVQPGDYIYVMGGTYTPTVNGMDVDGALHEYPGNLVLLLNGDPYQSDNLSVASGTSTQPITLENYPGQHVIFENSHVRIKDMSYWIIKGIDFYSNSGISMNGNTGIHNIIIENNTFRNYLVQSNVSTENKGFVLIDRGDYNGPYDIYIWNNTFFNESSLGNTLHFGAVTELSCQTYLNCSVGTGYIDIENNTIHDLPEVFFFKNPMIGPIDIKGNTIYNANLLGTEHSSNVNFTNNLVYNVSRGWYEVGYGSGGSYNFYNINGQNLTIINNTFVGLDHLVGGGGALNTTVIKHNIIFGLHGELSGFNWNTYSYISKDLEYNDSTNPAQSILKYVRSDYNCIFMAHNDSLFAHRYMSLSYTDAYTYSQAEQYWNWDTHSNVYVQSNESAVFVNPANNDYALKTPSQCSAIFG